MPIVLCPRARQVREIVQSYVARTTKLRQWITSPHEMQQHVFVLYPTLISFVQRRVQYPVQSHKL